MCDTLGNLVEGTMSNLFVVRDGELMTPEVTDCGIGGVMRAQVIETAKGLGIDTRIGTLSVEEAHSAEAIFLTNSLIGIWPVRQWDQRIFALNPVVGLILEQLQREQACA
jgi:4-amino-4-deoxychorismate lyase